MDYFIVVIVTATGLYFHWWLYVRMRRWMDRDLALSLAGRIRASVNTCLGCWSGRGRRKSAARSWRRGWSGNRWGIGETGLLCSPV